MLLQIDGSRHDWLEGRGPYLSLVGGIDDATGLVPWAVFREQEDAQGYFQLLREVVRRCGVPLAVYSDRHGIFFPTRKELTIEEALADHREPTQFGRLLEELGVELILARSPQGKGRVERLWGTFQDRLASELRLANATTLAQADDVLHRYLGRHNRRFVVPATDPTPAWLPWPKGRPLDELFCFKYRRVVANDHTIRLRAQVIAIPPQPLRAQVIDIPPQPHRLSFAKVAVELREHFDGRLQVYYEGRRLTETVTTVPTTVYRVDGHSQEPSHEPRPILPEAIHLGRRPPPVPPPDSPWRKFTYGRPK